MAELAQGATTRHPYLFYRYPAACSCQGSRMSQRCYRLHPTISDYTDYTDYSAVVCGMSAAHSHCAARLRAAARCKRYATPAVDVNTS
jgi:hypothetical protein